MRKQFGIIISAVLTCVAVLLGMTLTAEGAQAYGPNPSNPGASVTFGDGTTLKTVVSGSKFTVTATSVVSCDWTLTFAGQTATGSGKSFTATFTAPNVSSPTDYALNWTCAFSTTGGTAGMAIAVKDATVSGTLTVHVVPATTSAVAIPNTGGPSLLWIPVALLVVAAGVALVFVRRRTNA